MNFYRPGVRVCSRTGLVLVPAAGEREFRVASSSYGALNPPVRGLVGSDVLSWSRHDTYGGRTVYTASTRRCAFDEVLAGFRRRLGTTDSLVKDAAAVGLTVAEFIAAMEQDWASLGVLYPGHVPAVWRTGRLMFTVTLPTAGWWVALDAPESIAAIRSELGDRLALLGVTDLDLTVLYGGNRAATVQIADWVRSITVDDDTRPHGIVYRSRHAGGDVHAYWLRAVDAGLPLSSEAVTADVGASIPVADPDLLATATRYGLVIH